MFKWIKHIFSRPRDIAPAPKVGDVIELKSNDLNDVRMMVAMLSTRAGMGKMVHCSFYHERESGKNLLTVRDIRESK